MEASNKNESYGITSGVYSVSRTVLLDWLNDILQLNITKIEQCATGAVYCQIIDCLYPGTFKMSGINWKAKQDFEYMDNYKILQNAFRKNGITKVLNVDMLIKARY